MAAKITATGGTPTACKVQFSGRGGTAEPNFGPDSAIHGVRNVYYTENGKFRVALAPGEYDVIVSYGPEYDAVFTTLTVKRGKERRSRPSSSARSTRPAGSAPISTAIRPPRATTPPASAGRVLNLLAEHIEFAPCTEHNRITVYDPHLKFFAASGC